MKTTYPTLDAIDAAQARERTMLRSATMSPCGAYRYLLKRHWGNPNNGLMAWVMLNPSTADGNDDDQTIRKCVSFAKSWGFAGLTVVNLFAYRSTDAEALPDDKVTAVGPENDEYLQLDDLHGMVVAAWGTRGVRWNRDQEVLRLLTRERDVYCLRRTQGGHPEHPLYVPYSTRPIPLAKKGCL